MDLLILAGGLGTRLGDLTKNIPKPLISVNEKPFIDYVIKVNGEFFERIFLSIGYKKELFYDRAWPSKIRFIEENEPLGTGGAIINALPKLSDTFVVANGDTMIYPYHIERFLEECKLNCIYIVEEEASEKGTIELDGEQVAAFKEKKESGRKWVYAGVAMLNRDSLEGFLDAPTPLSLEKTIFPKLAEKEQLYAFKSKGTIYDIGTYKGLDSFKRWVYDHKKG